MYPDPRISASLTLAGLLCNLLFPQAAWTGYWLADSNISQEVQLPPIDGLVVLQGQALIQPANPDLQKVVASRWVVVTAYSSTLDQTDSTPFITASGSSVRDGIIACNFLSFGTRVKFPEFYGDKVFIVEDRMAPKNNHKMDIWFTTRNQAKEFGVKVLKAEILEI